MGNEISKASTKQKKVSKKLVNDPLKCVRDSLEGYVQCCEKVKLLEGYDVVVRSDVEEFKNTNKVVLITGGGSGHEPAHVGYIGEGMLTAAVCGDVFTSPSSSSILDTIRTCAGNGGALLIVKNYTGDRLNFGKAAEVAKGEGVDVETVIVDDDCALTSKDKSAGRRGLCGTIFIHKMAGAMAEERKSLNEITTFLRDAVKEIGTISISLSPCSIPGKPPNFTITDDIVEFGLGIHGEAGVSQIKMTTASDLVGQMIEHVNNSGYLPSLEGENVALIVNNLGGTSNLELPIIAKEAIKTLADKKVTVERCYVGTFVTSMEMAGVSITIMVLNEERLRYLDAPCDAPAWSNCGKLNPMNELTIPCKTSTEPNKTYDEKAEGNGLLIFNCTKQACNDLVANEEKLNNLDRAAGDGDTGTTLARGAKGILTKLNEADHVSYPINDETQFCLSLAKDIETTMGGSSGALISLLFTAASNAFKDYGTISTFSDALFLGIEAMKKYGGAVEGDRTMLDALSPALSAVKKAIEEGLSVKEVLAAAAKEARAGAVATTNMNAKAGRASYVANAHLTQPDPGAFAVALVFEAIEKAYTE